MLEKRKIHEYFTRYSDAPWMSKKYQVTVGGIGGIGGNVATLLSSMDTDLLIYEDDTVDKENCGPQSYDQRHIGIKKTEAFRIRMEEKLGKENVKISEGGRLMDDSVVTPICFSCFDSMLARKNMFNAWVRMMKQYAKSGNVPKEAIFIDGRMTAEYFEVFFVRTSEQAKRYLKEHMFPDSEAAQLACSYKSTLFAGMGISHKMIQGYVNHISNVNVGDEYRLFPFHYVFNGLSFTPEIEW